MGRKSNYFKMNKNQEVLKAYAAEVLKENGYQAEDEILDFVATHIQLSEGESNEEDEERSVDIHEDTDGTFSMKQFNYYNAINIRFYDIIGLGIESIPILALPIGSAIKIIYIVFKLIHKFHGELESDKFNETDAKIMYAIWHPKKKEFKQSDVKAEYAQIFKEEISDERLARSISFFRKRAIIKHRGDGVYRLIESVEYEKDY